MAVRVAFGGNAGVLFGGVWNNTPFPWACPLGGLSEMTLAFTVKPDPTDTRTGIHLFHVWRDVLQGQLFTIRRTSSTSANLTFILGSGQDVNYVSFTTTDNRFLDREWNRVVCRWRKSPFHVSIWINGTACAGTSSGDKPWTVTRTPIDADWMIGADTAADASGVFGDYAEVAVWSQWRSDLMAQQYGTGMSPLYVDGSATGRVRYARLDEVTEFSLRAYQPAFLPTFQTHWGYAGVCPWSGYRYVVHTDNIATHPQAQHPQMQHVNEPLDDYAILPRPVFEPYELLGQYGRRTGTIRPATTDAQLESALSAALYGDDIVIPKGTVMTPPVGSTGIHMYPNKAITAATPRMPPASNRWLTGQAALTGSSAPTAAGGAPTAEGRPPSYIVVRSDGTLPTPSFDEILMPDGSTHRLLAPSGRVDDTHAAEVAVLEGSTVYGAAINNWSEQSLLKLSRYAWHGIAFRPRTPQTSDPNFLIGIGSDLDPGIEIIGAPPNTPEWILFNQCMTTRNPTAAPHRSYAIAVYHGMGAYQGFVNGSVLDLWGAQSGDPKVFAPRHPGGYHFENIKIRQIGAAGCFTGGYSNPYVGTAPDDIIWRRVWQYSPRSWRHDRVFASGGNPVVANVSADGRTVTRTDGGTPWADNYRGLTRGCYLVDPATGVARMVRTAGGTTCGLFQPWPVAPATGITFHCRKGSIVYTSGAELVPSTATTNGTTAVTFSKALPAHVKVGHYFQQNHNQVTRSRIDAIAGNRLSCTLATAFTGPSVPFVFPYTITPFDGIDGRNYEQNKGLWETKAGNRMLFEGNVWDYSTSQFWVHPHNQTGPGGVMTVSRSGDIVTLLSGSVWPFPMSEAKVRHSQAWRSLELDRSACIKPGPHGYLCFANNGAEYPTVTQLITEWLSNTTVRVGPGSMPQGTQQIQCVWVQGAWGSVSDFCWRYNVADRTGNPPYDQFSSRGGFLEYQRGFRFHHHDELSLRAGAIEIGAGGLGTQDGTAILVAAGKGDGAPGVFDAGKAANDSFHFRNQTWAHIPFTGPVGTWVIINQLNEDVDQAFDIDLSNNLMPSCENSPVIFCRRTIHPTVAENPLAASPNRPTGFWNQPYAVARNVLQGRQIEAGLANNFPFASDNSGVPTTRLFVGYRNYDGSSGPDEPDVLMDPDNYLLDDIFDGGTAGARVNIPAGGLTAALTSGVFPFRVQPGQYFRTIASPTVRKITSINGDGPLSASWVTTYTSWSAPTRFRGMLRAGTLATAHAAVHTQALANDQWASILIGAGGIDSVGILLRTAASPTATAYLLHVSSAGSRIFLSTAGATALLANGPRPADVVYNTRGEVWNICPGTTLLFEAIGTTLIGSYLPIGATVPIELIRVTHGGLTAGAAGIYLFNTFTTLDNLVAGFSCGTYSGATRVTAVTETFDAGRTTLTLASAYPDQNVSFMPFVVTFKGSGDNGQDPGANIPLLKRFLAGVRGNSD